MQRAAFVPIALIAWGLLVGSTQAQDIGVVVNSFEGRENPDLARLGNQLGTPIGEADCDSLVTFRFTGIDVTRSALFFFHGSSCNDPMVRTDMTSSACQATDAASVAINGRAQQDPPVLVRDLLPCDMATSGVRTIWVLALNDPTDAVTGAGQQVSFPLAYDFQVPSAPTDPSASGGEARATLTWSSAGSDVVEYQVFADATGCTDDVVTSPVLTGDPPDEGALAGLLTSTAAGTSTSASVSFPASVPVGGQMAVAVRGVDRAGNVGALSTPVCVTRFEVDTWWDSYCPEGDTRGVCSGGCAAAPGRDASEPMLALLGLVPVALVLRRRSR